ncbi:hypothetical protein FGK63_16955 [Ruegeria sediminis]|uniref:Uncharacterized protein n=1 Tax=Ruegeria sediminis TaxID=2583820 RepID=A0ABY2WTC2_9RHOB|nr:hypothetical protein [Ruegeria sediminis]TMV04773.1 hypothetical protein FGK63_16955 [Ruegeria sediminis]
MKKLLALAAISMIGLSACVTDTGTAQPTVVDTLVGKRLVSEGGTTFIFYPDGTVGGSYRGEPVVGTFSADAREVCSTYTAPKNLVGQEFCSTPAIDGAVVVFNRRDGSQSPPYSIRG